MIYQSSVPGPTLPVPANVVHQAVIIANSVRHLVPRVVGQKVGLIHSFPLKFSLSDGCHKALGRAGIGRFALQRSERPVPDKGDECPLFAATIRSLRNGS